MRNLTAKLGEFFGGSMPVLTPSEQAELNRCVDQVRRGLGAFLVAGEALGTIKAKQLYRATHPTFEMFAQAEFGLTARRLAQLIESFEIVQSLKSISPSLPTPVVEAAVRPLAGLPEVDQAEAYLEAVEDAGGEAPSPKQVKAAADKRRPARRGRKVARPVRLRVPGGSVIVEPNKAFQSVEACLLAALEQLRSKAAA